MRALLLIAGAALALSGCGKNDQKDNNQIVDENLTAGNIVSNDVTAIDAVTGDAANMAADVDTDFGNLDENAEPGTSTPARPSRAAPKNAPPASTEATTNSVANSAANAE
ncbi:MAG TPA: hypothetical protein VM711_07195 [Sphingomicrobium sp.]|nr:hypothetical protein [Sphingomicrobium sp.]